MYYSAKDGPKINHLNKNNLKNKNYNQPNIFKNPGLQAQNQIYNIKVNSFKNKPKEKIIEGELNFNYNRVNQSKMQTNNAKTKKNRNMPRKSPIPIPKERASKLLPYQKYFINNKYYMQNKIIGKPKSAFPHKNNNLINKNNFKPNPISKNPNFPSNKTYNTFNILKKNLQRTNSPLLHSSATNNAMNAPQKGVIKTRYVSKSPILLKGSIFNRYKMFGFGNSSVNSSMNSISNNQKIKKKTPIKNNQKKMVINQQKHINPNYNNMNNMRGKGQTLISGEIIQENNGKFNLNLNNSQNNNVIINMKPLYNPQNLKIESNNALLNIEAESNINQNQNQNQNQNNFKQKKENNNFNNNNLNNLNKLNNVNNNNENNGSNINSHYNNMNNNNEMKENNNKEIKKNNQRSLSQGPVDILKKNEEVRDKDKDKEKENELLQNIKKQNEILNEKKVVTKRIKDILPYTHVGFDGEEPKENNQDNYFIYKNFMGNKDYIYMSVCDGHGVEGHFVSDFIKETLPHDMSENLRNTNILTETQKAHSIITQTFLIANEKLVDNEEINSLFSGTTCVSVIYTPQRLIVPNIGDSRAVLGRLNKETGTIKAIDLSRDHKPTEKDEAQRIIDNDGRIQPFIEDGEFVGPERVWIKEEEVPGLAMTRSFGDRVAATVGVMSEPEIKEFDFCEEDKYMIIASDGIWEFISSQECIDIIKDFYEKNDLKGCCEYLYQESSKRWLKEEEVIDDTTLILIFFE
jgi:serine/threonine protein phosphatase PrpC